MTRPATGAAGEVLAFLRAVRRRMQAQQLADALASAARISLALVLVLIVLHFALHALPGIWLALALALPALGIVGLALLRQPTLGQAALHADRALEGQSGFSTCLEFLVERRGTPSASALAALDRWSRSALAPARERLGRQRIRGLRQTVVTTASTSLVALAAAVLPGREAAQPPAVARATIDAVTAAPREASRHDPTAALRRALREAPAPSTGESATGSPQRALAAPAPHTNSGTASPTGRARERASAPTAGGDGGGRNAGAGAGMTATPAQATRLASALQRPVLRPIGAQPPAASGAASLSSPPPPTGDAALADTSAFDRRRVALARGAAAARAEPRAVDAASGPAAAALLRRWSQLESSR